MSARKACYYTFRRDGGEARVRFGFATRANSQIEVGYATWLDIARQLRDQGYRLIERPDVAPSGRPRKPPGDKRATGS